MPSQFLKAVFARVFGFGSRLSIIARWCLTHRHHHKIGAGHLFTLFPCLGFLFPGPTDWQGAQSSTQRVFELAEE